MSAPRVLVCAPADAPKCVPGSVFDRVCSFCGERVMVSPCGQRMLAEYPDTAIQCFGCFQRSGLPQDRVMLAGSREEIAREVLTAVPNLFPRRN